MEEVKVTKDNKVFCVFKIVGKDEPILWKIFKTRDNAVGWIEKYGSKETYIWEEWSIISDI